MDRLQLIQDGLEKIGTAYIENSNYELTEYQTMVLMYLVDILLKTQSESQELELKPEYPFGSHFGVLTLDEGVIAFSPRGVDTFPA